MNMQPHTICTGYIKPHTIHMYRKYQSTYWSWKRCLLIPSLFNSLLKRIDTANRDRGLPSTWVKTRPQVLPQASPDQATVSGSSLFGDLTETNGSVSFEPRSWHSRTGSNVFRLWIRRCYALFQDGQVIRHLGT